MQFKLNKTANPLNPSDQMNTITLKTKAPINDRSFWSKLINGQRSLALFSLVGCLSCLQISTLSGQNTKQPATTQNVNLDSVNYSLVPKALFMQRSQGVFHLDRPITIIAPEAWQPTADLIQQSLQIPHYQTSEQQIVFLKVKAETLLSSIKKSVLSDQLTYLSNHLDEAYMLDVQPKRITITAANKEGAIHAVFTLLQLQKLQKDQAVIPAVLIRDYPRFSYRGMMLDVSRNFFPPTYIKKFIDLLALYKFNNFHWHLTDGAGWRLEIKKYPKLTSMAAWRPQGPQTEWSAAGRKYSQEGRPDAYGGYYTQQEAKEIVAYAAARGINIIPEIEFPGHAEETIAAYPWLSATGSPDNVHELNLCNDSTFTFMENVLSEVMTIFPSTYIHIGGDEASKKSWKDCEACKVLMKKKSMQSLDQIQSYGVKRIEKFLQSHGRKLLGWDEIVEGGLAPDATVMVWRNPRTGYEVAREKHGVIMTPGKFLYFDHYQSNPVTEPLAIGGYIPLSTVYNFNPLPEDSLDKEHTPYLLGVQANLFTEYVPTMEHADYMLFPRTMAVSEIGWTMHKDQDFPDFLRRMQNQYRLLQRLNVNYCRPALNIMYDAAPDTVKKSMHITLSSERYLPQIHYTVDGTVPNINSPLYTKTFDVQGHKVIKAVIIENGNALDSIYSFAADYHKALGKKVYYNSPYSKGYAAAGDQTLTDGITGTLTYSDGRWQGFLGKGLDVIIDMDNVQPLKSVDIRFMQLTGPGVYMPKYVQLQLSDDRQTFSDPIEVKTTTSPKEHRLSFENYHFDLNGHTARYIKLSAPTQQGFIFTDEVVVY